MPTISFITANYVARALNYPGGPLSDWGKHDQATIAAASPDHFTAIARDVSRAGFEAVDVWSAHANWQQHDREDYLEQIKGICSNYDLAITSYAGPIIQKTRPELEQMFKFVKQLGAPMIGGGIFGVDPNEVIPIISDVCTQLGMRYAMENHPEKTPKEIMGKILDGKYPNVGIALDTGWCGTQGLDALEAAKALRQHLYIIHLKDVQAVGEHETTALGDGIVPVEKVVRYLKETGYDGNYGIEHEPFDRDPMPECKTSLERLKQWLR